MDVLVPNSLEGKLIHTCNPSIWETMPEALQI